MEDLLISESSTNDEFYEENEYEECKLCEDTHDRNELIELYDDVYICPHCVECINAIS